MNTSTDTSTSTTAALDFTPACDARGKSQINPNPDDCQHTAEFSAHVHACKPDHPMVLLLCQEHLNAGLRLYQAHISASRILGVAPRCRECQFEIDSIEDVIWDVQPIKQHHQQ